MRVSVFGLGYVGCVTAACLARSGHHVWGLDVDPDKVAMVGAGQSPIVEPGLAELMGEMTRGGRLRATTDMNEALAQSELALVCVGTPGGANGKIATDALERVSYQLGEALARSQQPFTIVVRSTVLPGTTERVTLPALRNGAGGAQHLSKVSLALNPEFMREGSSIKDFEHPPITLVGSDSEEAVQKLRALYAGAVRAPFVQTTIPVAEMSKYISNTWHALKVAFANEVGDVCEALGVDAHEVTRIFLMDRKLNASGAYLRPGFAFGGSCLPKDLRALLYAARTADVQTPVLGAIMPSNEGQVRRAVDAVLATRKKKVGVLGLAFKPGSDDLRESPLVAVTEALLGKGLDVKVLDRNLSLARLRGANRRFIEQEIPHLASLMCESVAALVDHAEVLVLGHPGQDAADIVAAASNDQIIIDLTRTALAGPTANAPAAAAVS
jgi:GDP-mannose 6-dehydrogenase